MISLWQVNCTLKIWYSLNPVTTVELQVQITQTTLPGFLNPVTLVKDNGDLVIYYLSISEANWHLEIALKRTLRASQHWSNQCANLRLLFRYYDMLQSSVYRSIIPKPGGWKSLFCVLWTIRARVHICGGKAVPFSVWSIQKMNSNENSNDCFVPYLKYTNFHHSEVCLFVVSFCRAFLCHSTHTMLQIK